MKVLGLDTSGDACSVALLDATAGLVMAHERVAIERGHAEILFAQIARVMDDAELTLKAVDRFAVTIGPGTFTGVRIGLSAARGLALASGRPLIGVNSLEVVAAGASAAPGTVIVAAFDARRGEFYTQAFRSGLALTEPFAASAVAAAGTLMRAAEGSRFAAIGTGAEAIAAALAEARAQCSLAAGDRFPDARVLAQLAGSRPMPAERPGPLYLRAPDAKLPARPAWAGER